jgi:hypothetical protein
LSISLTVSLQWGSLPAQSSPYPSGPTVPSSHFSPSISVNTPITPRPRRSFLPPMFDLMRHHRSLPTYCLTT